MICAAVAPGNIHAVHHLRQWYFIIHMIAQAVQDTGDMLARRHMVANGVFHPLPRLALTAVIVRNEIMSSKQIFIPHPRRRIAQHGAARHRPLQLQAV